MEQTEGRGYFVIYGTNDRIAVRWTVHTERSADRDASTFSAPLSAPHDTVPGGSREFIVLEPDSTATFERMDSAEGVLKREGHNDIRARVVNQRGRLILSLIE